MIFILLQDYLSYMLLCTFSNKAYFLPLFHNRASIGLAQILQMVGIYVNYFLMMSFYCRYCTSPRTTLQKIKIIMVERIMINIMFNVILI